MLETYFLHSVWQQFQYNHTIHDINFNFLLLIWDLYITLAPTKNNRHPWPPAATPMVGSKFTQSQIYCIRLTLQPHIQFHLNINPSSFLTNTYFNISQIQNMSTQSRPKNGQSSNFKKKLTVKALIFSSKNKIFWNFSFFHIKKISKNIFSKILEITFHCNFPN